jgi:Uncharacterized protein conserved in bacteria (DUF2147)
MIARAHQGGILHDGCDGADRRSSRGSPSPCAHPLPVADATASSSPTADTQGAPTGALARRRGSSSSFDEPAAGDGCRRKWIWLLRTHLDLRLAGARGGRNMQRVCASARVAVCWSIAFLVGFDCAARAQSPAGQWTSEGGRAEIEIYSCGTAEVTASNQAQLDTLCSYVKDSGSRLCGRLAKMLPKGLAELQAKGKKAEDVIGQPVLCVASGSDQTWPWKGGVFNVEDGSAYWVRIVPQGSDKLKGSACGLGGWYCPARGEFIWTKAAN